MVFIDTNVIIDFLAGDEKIVSLIKELAAKEEIKTTTINEYELLKHDSELKKEIAKKFLSSLSVFSFDRASAEKAASIFRKLKESGTMINENDLLIAGISFANDDILFTRDQKFTKIDSPKIKII